MPRRAVFWAIALCAVASAAWQAWGLRWTCDDAYISLRYAQHLVEGHGLVFNLDPTEAPVEGYTNFTWTLWLALGMRLGCTGDAIETWSNVSGVLCHAGTVLLLAAMAWRRSGGRALVPTAACGYAALHHAASLAPAGLETALFVLLAAALFRSALHELGPRGAFAAGLLGVLCSTTRPDGALFAGLAGLFVAADALRRHRFAPLVAFALPFAVLFVPYLLWRHAYYGYWVPNTFYAKSAGDPYPGQGLVYVWEFLKCYWVLLPVCAVPFLGLLRAPRRPWLAVLAFVVPYFAFVVWVGGDFMFGRFLLPILPALLFSLDLAASTWRREEVQPVLTALLVAGLVLRAEPDWLSVYDNPHGFSDNRRISMKELSPGLSMLQAMRFAGEYLHGVLDGLDVRMGIAGSHANLAYRSRVPVAVECAAGLTDAHIAHAPLAQRGTVGHERGWPAHVQYLVSRGVQIMLDLSYLAPGGPVVDATSPYRDIVFPPVPARLVIYDKKLLAELKRRDPNIQFPDFEQVLDAYLADLPKKTKADVAKDFAAFRSYYFDHNDDAPRRQKFEEFLR